MLGGSNGNEFCSSDHETAVFFLSGGEGLSEEGLCEESSRVA